MWDNRSKYLINYDGDTVTYLSDMGRKIYNEANHRLLGVWAPEIGQPGSMETKEFVRAWHMDRMNGHKWPFLVTTTLVHATDPYESEVKKTIDRLISIVTCIETNEVLNFAVQKFVTDSGYGGGIGAV